MRTVAVREPLGPVVVRGLGGALLCLAVTTLPFLYGFFKTPADRVYTGLMFDVPDHAQYWSWVTASRAALFIPNTMTPEPNAASFLNPAMWMLAKVQLWFGLTFAALFQWWRVAAAVVVGPALAVAMSRLARTPQQARVGFWLALAGGGLGWILIAAKYAMRLPEAPFPEAIYIVEPNMWFGLLAYPYLPLAQGFMLIALVGALRLHQSASAGAVAACALGALGVALLHAYDLVVVYAVLGAFWIVETARNKGIQWRLSSAIVLILVCSAPLAGYYQYLTSADPLWRSVLAQYVNAGVWTPIPPLLPVLMGVPLLFALWRLRGLDWAHDGSRFAAVWTITGLGLVYVPTVFQVKLLAAWQVPLAVLAADLWCESLGPAVSRWASRFAGRGVARWAPALVLAGLVLPTNAYLIVWRLIDLRRPESPYYVTKDEAAALQALAAHSTKDDVALAVEDVGRWVPNYGTTRAYLAHWAMTNHYLERRDIVDKFFAADTDDTWRLHALTEDKVTMVVWTDRTRAQGKTYDPSTSPLFDTVFSAPTAAVYRVRPVQGR